MKAGNVNFGSLYKNKEMSNIMFVAEGRITWNNLTLNITYWQNTFYIPRFYSSFDAYTWDDAH